MKKKSIILLLAAMFAVTSCGDSFLEKYPQTSITSPSFYKTVDHFDQALNGAYAAMRYMATDGMFIDEMRSDNAFYTIYYGDRGPYENWEKPSLWIDDEVSANGGPIYYCWQYNYQSIARVNTILDRLDVSELTDAEKSAVKAEALFLRGFYYFDLVKHFGGVPLNLKEVLVAEDAFLPSSSVEEVYNQILLDLNEAVSIGLPIPKNFPEDNTGRATMGALRVLRAYVNMTKPNPDYATAEADLKAVTQMNYGLLDDYASVFDPKNKNHKETILDVQYMEDGSTDQYSAFAWRMCPKVTNIEDVLGIGGANYAGSGVPGYSGGWVVPTKRMIDSYEEGDKRLPASIIVLEGRTVGDEFFYEKTLEAKGYTCPAGKDYRYMVKKYYHPPYKYSRRTNENFPVYRYSGALLLLSECLVREGKGPEALPYINQVRQRAGLNALSSCTMDNVANEMKHELAFENHRYSDIIRQGIVKEVMQAYGEYLKQEYSWVKATNNDGCFKIEEWRYIYAIPYRELQINNLLQQNPNYKGY